MFVAASMPWGEGRGAWRSGRGGIGVEVGFGCRGNCRVEGCSSRGSHKDNEAAPRRRFCRKRPVVRERAVGNAAGVAHDDRDVAHERVHLQWGEVGRQISVM